MGICSSQNDNETNEQKKYVPQNKSKSRRRIEVEKPKTNTQRLQPNPQPMPIVEPNPDLQNNFQILRAKIVGGYLQEIPFDTIAGNDLIGFYYSGSWCKYCKEFTPILIETYKKWKASNKKIEIVFASEDYTENDFKEYFQTMPWYAYNYDDPIIKKVKKKHGVTANPTLLIFNKEGKCIDNNAKETVMKQKEKAYDEWIIHLKS